ncbi:tRNA guanosine(34) transglycosylase Tgt [Candidatus Uhrbacteria bacterium]|nr:tRNA guanosine(34) transglycosylase Tgt [Candidatus Uhrbacteria bacterium]
MQYFRLHAPHGGIRRGILKTPHGNIHTPFFMPIATRGAVRNISPDELRNLGAEIILSNTYHLIQRPGLAVLEKHGGLHRFMRWDGPLLTDSGGYQVFSLAKRRKITPDGVTFQSEIDGSSIKLTPESVIDAQLTIGSDIIMVLDECPPHPCSYEYAEQSLATTLRWAERSKKHFEKRMKQKRVSPTRRPLLFGIVQGGVYKKLRDQSVRALTALDFDGYAIGGLAVGEPRSIRNKVVSWNTALLPSDKPRYLMGVGKPEDIVDAVQRGVDMFDCVIPTREARHGRTYVWTKRKITSGNSWYSIVNVRNEKYKFDTKPLDAKCPCFTCKSYSKSYLRHLFSVQEVLGLRLTSDHNLAFYLTMMRELQRKKTPRSTEAP